MFFEYHRLYDRQSPASSIHLLTFATSKEFVFMENWTKSTQATTFIFDGFRAFASDTKQDFSWKTWAVNA